MVKKSAHLPLIRSNEGRTPFHKAALLRRRDMVSYLFSVTPLKDLTLDERMEILVATITYDILALKILDKDETLETANKRTLALPELARKLLQLAAQQESVFNLIYETAEVKEMILTYVDDKNENILHLAGYLAPSSRLNIVSGAALQMQQELLWFKETVKIGPPSYLNMKSSGLTPGDLFTKKHKNLWREGEKWMKDTANYCMIVATLITTVVFATAFTVPGGSSQDTGTPILLKSIWFRVFFISDAIALFSSSSSILIFLSILTSRFTEMDFLVSLPSKLVLGLTTLFISIAGMVAAFIATCFLVFKSEMISLPTVIIALAGVPIILFVLLHY
ncbi:uncharacterized protein LOC115966439 [Quercus lobata]|uniref:uncharacterized protein LOC115966439 n=1 Tax=Quercus lobata TaxID=97700 RepID=UPI00124558B8|nr:uncharacterized protein LOC115966439 [Quercus lobata]